MSGRKKSKAANYNELKAYILNINFAVPTTSLGFIDWDISNLDKPSKPWNVAMFWRKKTEQIKMN